MVVACSEMRWTLAHVDYEASLGIFCVRTTLCMYGGNTYKLLGHAVLFPLSEYENDDKVNSYIAWLAFSLLLELLRL